MNAVKRLIYLLCLLSAPVIASSQKSNNDFVHRSFTTAAPLYTNLLQKTAGNYTRYPHSMFGNDTIKYFGIDEWTGGFWPGILWYMFEYIKDTSWQRAATAWTESLEKNQFNTAHHDIGFMMYCSYGNALRFQNNPSYEKILLQSAESLTKRYSPVVGCIQSWNKRKSKGDINTWEYPVIMDNMMNLELLFYASRVKK